MNQNLILDFFSTFRQSIKYELELELKQWLKNETVKCQAYNKNSKQCCHKSQPNSKFCLKHKNYILQKRSSINFDQKYHNHIFEVGIFFENCDLCKHQGFRKP